MRGLTLGDPALLGAAAGFSPLSLSPALWLDASDAATITSSGGLVSQWNDKSGNGRNFTQGTASNQPTTGATTQNGRNVVTFDGGDVLSGGDVIDLGTNSVSMFAVVRYASGVAGFIGGKYRATPLNGSYAMTWQTPTTLRLTSIYRTNNASSTATSGATWTSTGYNTLGMIIDRSAGTLTQRVNGANNGTSTFTTDTGTSHDIVTGWWIGALRNATDNGFVSGFYLNGGIAEMIVCLTALSVTQRDAVETYLKNKWATP